MPHTRLHCKPTTTSRDLKIVVHFIYIQKIKYNVTLTQQCSGDKIEKNEMGGASSAFGGEERRIRGFGGET
jgi:hypothetical protein